MLVVLFASHPSSLNESRLSGAAAVDNLPSPTRGNTKQLFVSLAAEYETKVNKANQVSIWDRVVEKKEDAILQLTYVRNKYKLVDQGSNLRGLPVNLTLEWNVMPITGSMSVGRKTFTGFRLPEEYTSAGADPSMMGSPHTGGRASRRYAR